jgi:hypothetical protein
MAHGSSRRGGVARAPGAVFALALLLGPLGLPLLGLVTADEQAPFCCRGGRCCCADDAADSGDGPCLRRGCGCERPDATVAGEPLRIGAVLPASSLATVPASHRLSRAGGGERPLARPHAPPVPPPRRPLPA